MKTHCTKRLDRDTTDVQKCILMSPSQVSPQTFGPGIRLEPGNREFPVRVKLPGKWHSNEGKTGKISFQYIYDRENDTKNRPKPGKKRTKY